MVIIDTSVWIAHFRKANAHLQKLLSEGEVFCHHFIVGEIACGNIHNRTEIISLMQALPSTPIAAQEEILSFIDHKKLYGAGIGLIDVHLLASAFLTKASVWTVDNKLQRVAAKLNILY